MNMKIMFVFAIVATAYLGAMDVSLASSESQVLINGNMICLKQGRMEQRYHIFSVGSYLSIYFQALQERLQSPRGGLVKLSEEWTMHSMRNAACITIEESFRQQNYIVAFNLLQQKKSSTERIQVLEHYANKGHVVAMCELARELWLQDKEKNKGIVTDWIARGYLREVQDRACCEDPSLQGAELIVSLYLSLGDFSNPKAVLEKNKEFVGVLSLDTISPSWSGYRGMRAIINGVVTMKPQNQWASIRKETLEKIGK